MPKRTKKSEQVDEATTQPTEAKPKRAKQNELPGMESPKHPELDTLLELYAEKASALSTARFDVGELKTKIIETATKLGLTVYRDDTASPPLVLTLTESSVKVKVTPAGTALDDEDEGDDE